MVIRNATPEDRHQIDHLYERTGYRGHLTADAVVFLAEEDGRLIGIVRLEPEAGMTVLRGMRVVRDRQRQRIGTALLDAVAKHLCEGPCYCIPYRHLTGFYGGIGFAEIAGDEIPAHLQERLAQYQNLGLDVTVLKRAV